MSKMTGGFLIDAPNVWIKSKINQAIVTATQGQVTFGGDSLTINGGWSFSNLAEIDTSSTIEVSLTNSRWEIKNAALTSGGTIKVETVTDYRFGELIDVSANKITIPYEVVPGSVVIDGLTETTDTIAENQFKVTIGTGSTEVEFFADEFPDGETVEVGYERLVENVTNLTTTTEDAPSTGMVILKYPMYEDEDGKTGIVGYVQIVIFKGKIQRGQTIGGSYKSASTFDTTITSVDPRRSDKKMFDISILPAD